MSKEDYNDDEEEKEIIVQKLKCQLCHQFGHKAFECDKDPNIRTYHNNDDELYRVEKIMQIKKKFIDNFTVTKLMLEKLSLLANERVTNQVLSQDDFNYAQFNDQIFDIDLPF